MKTKGKFDNKKRIFIAAAAVAALVLISLLSSLYKGGKDPIEEVIPKELVSYNDNVLLVSSNGIQLSDSKGKAEWELSAPNSETLTRTRGKYILLADIAANKLTLTYGGKLFGEYISENKVISANVNRRGDIAAVCEEAGYKGMIVLLDKKGHEKFRWHCGEGYLTDVDLSPNGRYVAASMILTDGVAAGSKMIVVDTKTGEVSARAERSGSVTGTIRFTNSGNIITVADNEIIGYGRDGSVRYEISFGGRQVSDFNIENENNIVIAVENSKNNTTLEIYSANGKLRGSYEANGELKNITVNGNNIAASRMRDVYCISPKGKLRNTKTCEHEIKDLCLFGGGRKAFVLGGGGKYSIIKVK